VDSDTRALRRASRRVGVQIAVACAVVVVAVVTPMYLFIVTQVKPGELFELIPDTDNLDVSAGYVLRGTVITGGILIVLAGLLSWFVTRRAVKPLGTALRMQRTFVADASHELRTPLTVLDARLQVLQRGLTPDDPSAAIVAQLRNDAKSLVDMVNDLLLAAETGDGHEHHASPTPLGPAIAVVVKSMQLIADDTSVRIIVNDPAPLWTLMPETSMHRCLVALLDNALQFAPKGSEVVVGVSATRSTIMVTVRDHGPGIQGISPDRIFDRFAHARDAGDEAVATRTGFGIGLSLVRDMASRNGGSVTVVRSSADGTEIGLSLPRAHIH
jgi:signal transduction histidine kinase